jgi:hypothetical protein
MVRGIRRYRLPRMSEEITVQDGDEEYVIRGEPWEEALVPDLLIWRIIRRIPKGTYPEKENEHEGRPTRDIPEHR